MEHIEPEPGDVLLVEPDPDTIDSISRTIQIMTKSRFSHGIVALSQGSFAEANIAEPGKPDVRRLSRDDIMTRINEKDTFHLYRPDRPVDAARLEKEVKKLEDRAMGKTPDVIFADGAALSIALLRALHYLRGWWDVRGWRRQLRRAALYVNEQHGDRRLFCTEFAFRVLEGAGCTPQISSTPIVPVDDFPRALVEWQEDQWLGAVWRWLADWLKLDDDSKKDIEQTQQEISKAFAARLAPRTVHPANYFTPQDFALSPSFHCKVSGWQPSPGI